MKFDNLQTTETIETLHIKQCTLHSMYAHPYPNVDKMIEQFVCSVHTFHRLDCLWTRFFPWIVCVHFNRFCGLVCAHFDISFFFCCCFFFGAVSRLNFIRDAFLPLFCAFILLVARLHYPYIAWLFFIAYWNRSFSVAVCLKESNARIWKVSFFVVVVPQHLSAIAFIVFS